jgi:hypothetical protein
MSSVDLDDRHKRSHLPLDAQSKPPRQKVTDIKLRSGGIWIDEIALPSRVDKRSASTAKAIWWMALRLSTLLNFPRKPLT